MYENQTGWLVALTVGLSIMATKVNALDVGIMADVTLSASTDEAQNSAFQLGQFDIFATQLIGENDKAFAEFVFEDAGGFVIDLERIWVEHQFSKKFRLLAGRYHSPLGYYNRTYHHGAFLQFSVTRPSFLDFEDGPAAVLPTHMVGLMGSGDFYTQSMRVSYEFAVGNGGSINTDGGIAEREIEMNNISDPNEEKSAVLRFVVNPAAIPLQLGLFSMINKIAESGSAASQGIAQGSTLLNQTIFGVDFKYEGAQVSPHFKWTENSVFIG